MICGYARCVYSCCNICLDCLAGPWSGQAGGVMIEARNSGAQEEGGGRGRFVPCIRGVGGADVVEERSKTKALVNVRR